MNIFKSCMIFAVVAVFAAACDKATPTANTTNTAAANTANKVAEITPNQPSAPVDQLASGKEIYATNCMICHKDSGKGGKVTIEGKSLDATNLTSPGMVKKTDEKLYAYISDGVPDEGMPAFADKLKADEIKAVVAHIRTLQKP